ncbi:MAG: hypothetical protein ACOC4C_05005 [Fibrobacterota bacterium]
MKQLWTFLRTHGYTIMVIGMAMTAAGAYILFQAQRVDSSRTLGLTIGITGLAIYLTGRIGILYRNSLKKKK